MQAGANRDNMIVRRQQGHPVARPGRPGEPPEELQGEVGYLPEDQPQGPAGSIADALVGADVLISASTPGPGTIKPEWIAAMAKDAIVFAEANPIPEIWPWEAKEAGARIVATGRSDFPNQVNNSLGFPGIFRGALDVRARTITDGMCIAAARELAKVAEDKGLHEEYIIPNMDEWEVFPREAVAVGSKAIEEGVARFNFPADVRFKMAEEIIRTSREDVQKKMREGVIVDPDK